MRQADVEVGVEYAVVESKCSEVAAKIRPIAPAKKSQVEADLLEMPESPSKGVMGGLTTKPGSKTVIVSTRHIFGKWEDWLAEVARRESETLRREKRRAHFKFELEDLTNPDPQRTVPASYEIEDWFGADIRWDNSSSEASLRLGEAATTSKMVHWRPQYLTETAALFKDLPAGLCRDIVAALRNCDGGRSWADRGRSRVPKGATVAVALARAARLLDALLYRLPSTTDPDTFLNDADVAFISAVVTDVESRGGEFRLPFVPPLPPSNQPFRRHDENTMRVCEVLGWIRLGIADTEGVKLHAVGCQHLSESRQEKPPNTWPWWQVRLSSARATCATCGGPSFASPLEIAHFVTASDVWAARGGGEIEKWQRLSVVRLMNVVSEEAARRGEGQPSLDALVAAELMKALPGQGGYEAYRLFLDSPYGYRPHDLDKDAEARAIMLARERMEVVRAALPIAVRPDELPASPTLEQIRQRHEILSELVLECCLDKFLFSLHDWH